MIDAPAAWVGLIFLFDHAVLLYALTMNTQMLIVVLIGFRQARRLAREVHVRDLLGMMQSPLMPPVSVIVTCYNEENFGADSVHSLLHLQYPQFEVVVVNDGSTDGTLEVLRRTFGLRPVKRRVDAKVPSKPILGVYESEEYPHLVVIDKINGGKGDALNAGINFSLYPLFCAMDGDSVLEGDALLRVARPFYEHPESMVAAGGTIRIINGCEVKDGRVRQVRLPSGLLAKIQLVEYLRAFLLGRTGWSALGGLLLISGAFGIFEKKAVIQAGGYATDSVGEDLELMIRVHRTLRDQGRRYRVGFVPEPVCWTEAPHNLSVLRRQRDRWQRGLIDSLWRHRDMMFRPRYGMIGMIALPSYLMFEMLAPVVESVGYLVVLATFALGVLDVRFMLAFVSAALLYSIVLSIGAVLLDDLCFRRHPRIRDLVYLTLMSLLESLGYRQMTAVWRLAAFPGALRGDRSWGQMTRLARPGAVAEPTSPTARGPAPQPEAALPARPDPPDPQP